MSDNQELEKLRGLLSQLTSDADLDKRISKIEDNYKNNEEIDEMIWDRINVHQGNQDRTKAAVDAANKKADLEKINWTVIIQTVIAALIIAIISYMIQNRG